jgi:TM2 domain-containing membrane protein YozV
MKKRLLLFPLLLCLPWLLFAGLGSSAEAADGDSPQQLHLTPPDSEEVAAPPVYQLDTAALESAMRSADSVSHKPPVEALERLLSDPPEETDQGTLVAAIICCVLVGWLGVHRLVLGGRAALAFFYCVTSLTCCGLAIPLVDLVLMIVDAGQGGKSRYDHNDYWIAW